MSTTLKRKVAESSKEEGKENAVEGNPLPARHSWHQRHRAGASAVFKPFKPPLTSRPDADGTGGCSGMSLGPRKLVPGANCMLAALTRTIVVDKRPVSVDEANAPDVVVFDPEEHTGLPESSRPYAKILVDKFLAAKLRPHQVAGVQFMFRCLTGLQAGGYTGCIQSDSMGLGKTMQSIVTMWTLLKNGLQGSPMCTRTLIVTPSSLVTNWDREVDKWLQGRLKPIVMDDSNGDVVKKVLRMMPISVGGMGKPLVVICSYTTFRMHQVEFGKKNFQLLICDEAHQLKNGDSQITKAVCGLESVKLRLLLTGTPIQNDLSEYYAMFNTACPNLLGTPHEFRKQYELPILAGRDAGATDKQIERGLEQSNKLVELCSHYMLRRTSTVLKKYLPPKVQQVIFCKMSPLQRALYKGFLESAPVKSALGAGTKVDKTESLSTLPAITALKKLCCHPDLVHSLSAPAGSAAPTGGFGFSSSGCMVKQSAKPSATVITGFEGLQPVFYTSTVYPAYRPGAVQTIHSGKIQVLEQLLKAVHITEPTDKVVIVSNYTESLDLLKQMCDTNCWAFLRLDGSSSVKNRQKLVDEFNSAQHPSFVLLLSSKAGGVGLNIIGANRLVLFDPDWNPANDQQAMARVWREGQQKHVWIYRLLTTGSIEEKIWQRQLAKEGLSRVVVDDNANESRTFSRDELRTLFKVDPSVECDTHDAIKCKCMGSRAGQDDNGSEESGGSGEPTDANANSVLAWAHLRDVTTLPDKAWQHVSSFIRDKYITFAFSDHNLEHPLTPEKQHGEDECSDDESIERKGCDDEMEQDMGDDAEQGWGDDADSAD